MKVVLDTNVLVSALIRSGKPRELFTRLATDKQIILSQAILEEFLEVVEDPKVAKYVSKRDIAVFLNILGNGAVIVQSKSKFKAIKEDPDDDMIVRVAYDAKADCIVSGDKHLLTLKEFKGIKILTIDEMVSILNKYT
jgi:uncharacterized protein